MTNTEAKQLNSQDTLQTAFVHLMNGKLYLSSKRVLFTNNEIIFWQHLDCYVSTGDKSSRLCVIYHPPPSKQNGFTNRVFFGEWASYLEELAVAPQQLIITGDLNFHLDKPDSPDVHQFSGLLVTWFSSARKSCHTLKVILWMS